MSVLATPAQGSFGAYLDHIRPSLSINVAALVGHGAIRLAVSMLLATEAAINAVKHCGVERGSPCWINIALKQTGTDTLCLSIVNSRSTDEGTETDTRDTDGSGLGSRLIQSFVSQLDGTLETSMTDDRYELHVTFPLSWPEVDEDDALPAK